jgi:hypothetical protein
MLIFAPCRMQMQALTCFQRSTVPRVLHLCYHASFLLVPITSHRIFIFWLILYTICCYNNA